MHVSRTLVLCCQRFRRRIVPERDAPVVEVLQVEVLGFVSRPKPKTNRTLRSRFLDSPCCPQLYQGLRDKGSSV